MYIKLEIAIIIPVYNDWESLNLLLTRIELNIENKINGSYCIIIINDSSLINYSSRDFEDKNYQIHIINLNKNMGHQSAIACGLCYVYDKIKPKYTIIMDSDGEDSPSDIINLYNECLKNEIIIFAKRIKRTENITFIFFYYIYKLIFKILTNSKIDFGNFSIIPENNMESITNDSNLWINYASSIIKSKISYKSFPTIRGKRYYGKSNLSIIALMIHGFTAISIYTDIIAVRIVIFSLFTILIIIILVILVIFIRLYTLLAIPGWTTYLILLLIILLFQSIFISLTMLFLYITNKKMKNIIPIKDYKNFISKTKKINNVKLYR